MLMKLIMSYQALIQVFLTSQFLMANNAILDGQQRLTSLYLSLSGDSYIRPNYARKKTGTILHTKLLIELDKNKIAVDEEEYN